MIKKYLINLLTLLLVAGFMIYTYVKTPTIKYIDNARIFSEYVGMKAGKKKYDEKVSQAKSVLDTLAKEFELQAKKVNADFSKMSAREKELANQLLSRKQQDYINYKRSYESQIKEEDEKLSAAILNQMNTFIQEYGAEKHYDYILGVTENGNLFYAKKKDDITNEVLDALNKKYNGD